MRRAKRNSPCAARSRTRLGLGFIPVPGLTRHRKKLRRAMLPACVSPLNFLCHCLRTQGVLEVSAFSHTVIRVMRASHRRSRDSEVTC